jgi:hypothetical protein
MPYNTPWLIFNSRGFHAAINATAFLARATAPTAFSA